MKGDLPAMRTTYGQFKPIAEVKLENRCRVGYDVGGGFKEIDRRDETYRLSCGEQPR